MVLVPIKEMLSAEVSGDSDPLLSYKPNSTLFAAKVLLACSETSKVKVTVSLTLTRVLVALDV